MQSHGRIGSRVGLLALCALVLGARVASAQTVKTIIGWGNQDGLLAAQRRERDSPRSSPGPGSILVIEAGAVFNGGGFFSSPDQPDHSRRQDLPFRGQLF